MTIAVRKVSKPYAPQSSYINRMRESRHTAVPISHAPNPTIATQKAMLIYAPCLLPYLKPAMAALRFL